MPAVVEPEPVGQVEIAAVLTHQRPGADAVGRNAVHRRQVSVPGQLEQRGEHVDAPDGVGPDGIGHWSMPSGPTPSGASTSARCRSSDTVEGRSKKSGTWRRSWWTRPPWWMRPRSKSNPSP